MERHELYPTKDALMKARRELESILDDKDKLRMLDEDKLELEYLVMRLKILASEWIGRYAGSE